MGNLFSFTEEYMEREEIVPKNMVLWNMVKVIWDRHGTLPIFMTSFEIIRKGFMQRDDVRKFHDAVTEREPFGVFRYQWSHSAIRVLTAALFADSDEIMTSKPIGYYHGVHCEKKI